LKEFLLKLEECLFKACFTGGSCTKICQLLCFHSQIATFYLLWKFQRGGHLGVLETGKPKKKSSKTAKSPKKFPPKPKTAYTVKADTVVTRGAYSVNYTNTNFIKVFFVFMWRHHFPKLQISNPTEVLVSSDIRPY